MSTKSSKDPINLNGLNSLSSNTSKAQISNYSYKEKIRPSSSYHGGVVQVNEMLQAENMHNSY